MLVHPDLRRQGSNFMSLSILVVIKQHPVERQFEGEFSFVGVASKA